jgi:hypothetical protein
VLFSLCLPDWKLVIDYGKFLECVASLNIQLFCFSYKFFGIFVKEIVEVFSQSDVGCNFKKNEVHRKQ